MRALLVLLLGVWAWGVQADEVVSICHGYGCAASAQIEYRTAQLRHVGWLLAMASSPAQERALIGQAIGRMYEWAGQQSLVRNDRAGNFADDGQPGRMDCIDHSTSTTRLLRLMEAHGWLRWHRVLLPVKRARLLVLFEHYSAAIQSTAPDDEGETYVVDSWFVNNGEPAVVMPLDDWNEGGGPRVD